MALLVEFTADAERDLEEIYAYIAEHDSPERAEYVLRRIEAATEKLKTFPHGGSHPRELLELGVREFRQVFFKPYRLIYAVSASRVTVYLVADGRRDMQSLLARRLLGH